MSAHAHAPARLPMATGELIIAPARKNHWLKRFFLNLTKGSITIAPTNHKGEEFAAQRWPASAILSQVLSAAALVVMVVFTLFGNYSDSAKDSRKEVAELRERLTRAEGHNDVLQTKYDFLNDKMVTMATDLKAARTLLGMDIADGTRKPKER